MPSEPESETSSESQNGITIEINPPTPDDETGEENEHHYDITPDYEATPTSCIDDIIDEISPLNCESPADTANQDDSLNGSSGT